MADIYGIPQNTSVVSLARYARLIGYTDCAFFGVSHPENDSYACRELWTQRQREDIAYYLAEAQDDLESVLEYHLQPTWDSAERHQFKPLILAKFGKIIATGIQAQTDVSAGATVSHVTEPSTVSIVMAEPSYSLAELRIYHPDTTVEIKPSDIEYSVDSLVISIPRCRMVKTALQDNPPEGLVYTDLDNFETTVDVIRLYNDTTALASLITTPFASCTDCDETSITTCQYLMKQDVGAIGFPDVNSSLCASEPQFVEINYYSGSQILTRTAEMTLIRLAHSKMATEPCGCDIAQHMWRRDRNVPDILTKERIECPFGMSDGAWIAWRWALKIRLVRASALYRKS